jgi:hypothetical protein
MVHGRVVQRVDRDDAWIHETARGRLTLFSAPPGTQHTRVTGHFCAELASILLADADRLLTQRPELVVFHDWADMEGYDSAARLAVTSWCLHHLDAIQAAHLASGSKLVSMGIAVANIALGGRLNAYAKREIFLRVLNAHLGQSLRAAAD